MPEDSDHDYTLDSEEALKCARSEYISDPILGDAFTLSAFS